MQTYLAPLAGPDVQSSTCTDRHSEAPKFPSSGAAGEAGATPSVTGPVEGRLGRSVMPEAKFVSTDAVIAFVQRTLDRGVPMRVALVRAERRYGVQRNLVRQFVRAAR